ncbi:MULTISPECIES: isochorismatase family cysteine hydrolase [Oceanobacillus]|uniref:isochorismatase family cysteine hydrolase n=1 Tax=Oceanobacillus TaxID=182709 RepID=UPI00084E9470|nr:MULTISPECIES: isochorismatase family cysteine hydrolase [Oceanobacillus]MBT2599874.1 cysteine hydrolase [Oceanobacillus sp. ISL-74]MBT2652676.1 cysteine hydrolase [Oceanobacillus sp. ISL-73]MCT1577219.1 cysteine hydrolase [Oceanobacillus kimchii]MCT2135289.1 cysteine hydrolase [Oceanobacillus kimchii]OEH56555.1 isochorismatase [Oceanobacillus sp. E9]
MDFSPTNTAVVFVDLINDFQFDGGDDLLYNTKQIIPNIIKLRSFAKENNLPIIYVNDHYGLWQADFSKVIDYCSNEKSREIIEQVKPDDNDYFLIKPQHSAFFQTPLHSLLIELERNHIILAGIAGDICILFSAKDAYMYKIKMSIPKNCMASEQKENNNYALYLMESVMDADISPV